MDGVPCSWSTTRAQESFTRCRPTADTLSRLAKLVARADHKQLHPAHLSCCCPECGLGFSSMTELLHHQELIHSLPKPHKCLSCGKEFSLLSSLQLHRCDSFPRELGSPCVGGTSDPDSPREKSPGHQRSFIDSIPYACAPCGRGFSQKQALLHHQQAGCSEPPSSLAIDDHDASSPPADSPQTVSEAGSTPSECSDAPGPHNKKIVCPFCPRSFRTGAGLHCHTRVSHSEELSKTRGSQKTKGGDVAKSKSKAKLLGCRSCEMVFRSTAKLYLHRKENHSREKVPQQEHIPPIPKRRNGETYPCQVCGRVFLHHLSLRAHSKQHAAANAATVPRQGSSGEAERHPKKPQTTLISKKMAAGPRKPGRKALRSDEQSNGLQRASKFPSVEEEVDSEFPCPSCAKVFSLRSELRDHVELHQSSVRRRQCSVCLQEMDTSKGPGSRKHRLYHCVPCQRTFPALDTFLKHCQDHLRVKVEEEVIDETYRCHGNKN